MYIAQYVLFAQTLNTKVVDIAQNTMLALEVL